MKRKNLLIPLGLIVSLGLTFFIYYSTLATVVEKDTMRYVQTVIEQARKIVGRAVRDGLLSLESAASAIEKLGENDRNGILEFLDDVAYRNDFRIMGIVYPDGQEYATDGKHSKIELGLHFQKAFDGKSSLSNLTRESFAADSSRHANVYTAPLYANGKVKAAIFGVHEVENLTRLLALSLFEGKTFMYVIRVNGDLVAAEREEAIEFFPSIFNALRLAARERGESLYNQLGSGLSGSLTCTVDGKTYYATYEPVGEDNLFVLSVVPADIVAQEVSLRMRQTLVLVLVLTLLVSLLLAHLWQTRRQAERQALIAQEESAASKAKSAFLSTMSHEIRTPLNAIVGFLHLLGKTPLSVSQSEYMQKIRLSADALLRIINDVLDFSKIEAGRLEVEKMPFAPAVVLDAVISIVGELAQRKNLALSAEISPQVPTWLLGDPARITQILLNLLNNAIKFTEKGQVRVLVSRGPDPEDKGSVVPLDFQVIDSGIGLSSEEVSRLFKPFTQADSSTTRRFGGTGLGLAICRQLVELMGGTIRVESQPGQGSTFRFTLFLEDCPPGLSDLVGANVSSPNLPKPDASTEADGDERWDGVRVLLVEDNLINQEIFQTILEGFGIVVTIAENGARALEIAANESFALIFMDMQMPVMDGLTATRRLKEMGTMPEHAWLAHTPIVALTANAMLEDRQSCLEAGMVDFLSKPIDFALLKASLTTWLGSGASAEKVDP